MTFEEWWKREGFSKPDAPFAAEAWVAATMAERERCALVCDSLKNNYYCVDVRVAAEAIRNG